MKLAVLFTLFLVGGIVSISRLLTSDPPSITVNVQSKPDNCQVLNNQIPCSENDDRPGASGDGHCLEHCQHSQVGALPVVSVAAPPPVPLKTVQILHEVPERIAIEPGFRPPS